MVTVAASYEKKEDKNEGGKWEKVREKWKREKKGGKGENTEREKEGKMGKRRGRRKGEKKVGSVREMMRTFYLIPCGYHSFFITYMVNRTYGGS